MLSELIAVWWIQLVWTVKDNGPQQNNVKIFLDYKPVTSQQMAAVDPAWNDMLQLMEDVLSAPVQNRAPEIIQKILPVFRTRTPLLYDLSKGMSVSRITPHNE